MSRAGRFGGGVDEGFAGALGAAAMAGDCLATFLLATTTRDTVLRAEADGFAAIPFRRATATGFAVRAGLAAETGFANRVGADLRVGLGFRVVRDLAGTAGVCASATVATTGLSLDLRAGVLAAAFCFAAGFFTVDFFVFADFIWRVAREMVVRRPLSGSGC